MGKIRGGKERRTSKKRLGLLHRQQLLRVEPFYECNLRNDILKRILPHSIVSTGQRSRKGEQEEKRKPEGKVLPEGLLREMALDPLNYIFDLWHVIIIDF